MKHFLLPIFLILFVCCGCSKEKTIIDDPVFEEREDHHPFLIVKKDQYEALRSKAGEEPWKSMKDDALSRAGKGSASKPYDLQFYIGAVALAYILDEDNASIHAGRVRDAILNQYSKLELKDGSDWGGVVPPMGSFFCAILALDIVYDALSIEDIRACEEVIEDQIFRISRKGSWEDVRLGTHGTWDIYKGDRVTKDDTYYNGIMRQVTPDGVSPVTNHYAWERVGGGNSRVSKSGYMDVLEFTGIDNRYYGDERLQKFQKWLFGSSVNCSREMAIFGDMLPTQGISNDMLHRRVVNFDDEAAGYAAWFHEGTPAIGHILTYILPKKELPAPVVPSSKIYTNGGAFFREPEDDPKGLHGVLYNIMSQDEWHTHNEVNGLALSGYGNRLLVNGGRLGAPTRAAQLNNTLTINGENHSSRLGGGILYGFTGNGLDFAVGDGGPAMGGAKHNRNLIQVHNEENSKGYFVIYDEIEAAANAKIQNYLHPANQTTVEELSSLRTYEAKIDHYPTVTGTSVRFWYLTPPDQVNIEKSQSAVPDRYPGYPEHNRLEAVYTADETGIKKAATIIYPYQGFQTEAEMVLIDNKDFNAGRIIQGTNTDYIFETKNTTASIEYEGMELQGGLGLIRMQQEEIGFYLVRNGIRFMKGKTGFDSDVPITIYVKGDEGEIISSGATVKISGTGMEGVSFNNGASTLSSGTDFIQVQLPEGVYHFSK